MIHLDYARSSLEVEDPGGWMVHGPDSIFDVLGTASIGFLLVAVAIFLAVEMNSLLVGESATRAHREAIVEALTSPEAIDRVIHSKTMHLGPQEVLVAAKLAVGATDSAREVAAAIDEAERAARAAVPDIELVLYLEPDIERGAGDPAR